MEWLAGPLACQVKLIVDVLLYSTLYQLDRRSLVRVGF